MAGEFNRTKLMWASFLTLIASGFGFATRTAAGGIWEREFGIDGSGFGQILGAGFLGFGIMIFIGGILVEKFGYKLLLGVAFALHLVSAIMLFGASPIFAAAKDTNVEDATKAVFQLLWLSAFLFSIAQGLYEAVINPVIAQIYPDNKTHYLNILHAGWPGGMILGGLFAAAFIGNDAWFFPISWSVALSSFAIFVIAYGVLAFPEKFPKPVGQSGSDSFANTFSCFISIPFLVLIILHGCVGYMELGVDSWMTKLMENLLPNAILILVYTSLLMFVLRFFAGPIVHKINPIGLLFASSVVACLGLLWLGSDIQSIAVIFVAATFYSFGKAFLWPTMLGVAGERYPQSGSVAMGALGAAGMLTVGLIAGPRIGTQQAYAMSEDLKTNNQATFERYKKDDESTEWGMTYTSINPVKMNAANGVVLNEETDAVEDDSSIKNADSTLLSDEEKTALLENIAEDAPVIQSANLNAGRQALIWTAYVPFIMGVGFLGLLLYYRSIGGYKALTISESGELVPMDSDHGSYEGSSDDTGGASSDEA